MAHTPGPWEASPTGWTVNGPDYRIADIIATNEEAEAAHGDNARLIAAAPDLLAALELAQKWLANSAPVTELDGPKPLPVIAAAITKAKGGN